MNKRQMRAKWRNANKDTIIYVLVGVALLVFGIYFIKLI